MDKGDRRINFQHINLVESQESTLILPIFFTLFQPKEMFNQTFQAIERLSTLQKLGVQSSDPNLPTFDFLGVATGMMKVIQSQNLLIAKLLQRQSELTDELEIRNPQSSSGMGQNKLSSGDGKASSYREIHQQELNGSRSPPEKDFKVQKNRVQIIQNVGMVSAQYPRSKKNTRRFEEQSNSSDNEVESNSDIKDRKPCFKKKQTETKNMVKNFSKAIFSFIRKNREKRTRVLNYLGISDEDFMKKYQSLRGRIHSISELRSLWLPEGNIYHKAFRILSCEYLRKSCLQRTFNSRVQNFNVHLKYRQRLLESLREPEGFTILKTN